MKDYYFENNLNVKEDNIFNEYKSFKAEEYSIKENKDFSFEMKVDEFFVENKKIEKEKKSINLLNNINNVTQRVTSSISSIAVTSTIAIVSSVAIGIVPVINNEQPMEVVTTSLIDESLINEINIKGKITNPNLNYHYYALIDQFSNDEILEDNMITNLIFDNDNFTFSIGAYYGLTAFKYDIYYQNLDEDILLYSSDKINFVFNQEYQATYDKVSPRDAKFSFNDDGTINVHVETNFESEYSNVYKYCLNVLDNEGNICSQYIGNDQSIDLKIDKTFNEIEEIKFEYVDLGDFYKFNHEFERYLVDDVSIIKIPSINLDTNFDFIEDKFAIIYQFNTIYDHSSLSLDLILKNEIETINKHVDYIDEKGVILLDEFNGEIGNLSIEGILNFQDEILDKHAHKINLQKYNYQMNYYFDIINIKADVYQSGLDFIPLTFNFDYRLPSFYEVNISNNQGDIIKFNPTNEYYLNSFISSGNGDNINIAIYNNETKWKDINTYNILSYDEAQNNYIEPTFSNNVNPNESLVSFNEDGTINIYRDIGFQTENENIYYDAFIYNQEIIDDTTGKSTYINGVHNLSNNRYSILEDLEDVYYSYQYYEVLKHENIYYYVKKPGRPSGGIDTKLEMNIVGNYDETSNITTIEFSCYELIKDECYVKDNIYTMTSLNSNYSISVDGNMINENITLFIALYSEKYDELKDAIPVKGSIYKAYSFKIS